MEMFPWKRAWAGSEALGGTWSRATVEKPPRSASDMILHDWTVEGLPKSRSLYGPVGVLMASNVKAVYCVSVAGKGDNLIRQRG